MFSQSVANKLQRSEVIIFSKIEINRKMWKILIFLVILYIGQSDTCKKVSSPVITQINDELVMVDWVRIAAEETYVKSFILKYWKKDSIWDETPKLIEDLDTTFDYVKVEKGEIYSYQLIVKSSGNNNLIK